MQALIAVAAALAGILVGYWLRGVAARGDKAAADGERAQLAQRNGELSAEIAGLRTEIAQIRELAERRAGFESLCAERQTIIDRMTADREQATAAMLAKTEAERKLTSQISALEAELRNERQNMAEKVALLDTAEKKLTATFEALAGQILEKKASTFSQGAESLLNPLKEQIKDFRSKVEEAQKEGLIGRTELAAELKQLRDLNEKLSSEAHSLSTALRQDTQKQGHWGERILLQILENCGLRKGEHYTYQESHISDDENGAARRQQTDVIVKLPEGRHLIVDCKVTLNAYREYVDAPSDKERETAIKRLLKSFRDHYVGLAERNYPRLPGVESPDFVVLFAPIEPAFNLAIREDEALWTDAYQRGVLIAGPTTILFIVRIVESLWKQENHNRNVMRIVDRGEKLYEKFVGFVEDLENVGMKIQDAKTSYDEAFGKLKSGSGNLIGQVEKLRILGLAPKKKLKPKLLESSDLDEPLALAAAAEEAE